MNATIKVQMDNAAFAEGWRTELATILARLMGNLDRGHVKPGEMYKLRDTNGNTVGYISIEEDDDTKEATHDE